jgi:hypothetical protein
MEEKQTIAISGVPESLKDDIEEIAKRESRSFSQQCVYFLKKAVDNAKK